MSALMIRRSKGTQLSPQWYIVTRSKMMLHYLLIISIIVSTLSIKQVQCLDCDFLKRDLSGSVEYCDRIRDQLYGVTNNVPLIGGAYCFNNGSGICKAFAGRYEFYYDSFNDKFLRSAPRSAYVNEYGYHQRVPVAYQINGDILYADRSINWARQFAANELKGKKISLMSIDFINWCAFVADNYWPYKSAIKYNQYEIYFFNRQSCIIDKSKRTQPKQHFNTRFLHNSSVRQDLDMNPTIYAMEDKEAKEVRLVKHIRQHWHEVAFKVLEKPAPNVDLFVDMEPTDRKPCKICGGRPILPKTAYRAFSNVCLSDYIHDRVDGNNARLLSEYCGMEKIEIADIPMPVYNQNPSRPLVLEVDLHNIPRRPNTTTSFFGVSFKSDSEWVIWAKDGLTFSAATTIPTSNANQVRVIMLYATFNIGEKAPKYEEYDPMPYLADYIATYKPNRDILEGSWTYDRKSVQKAVKTLNYVDDIAYLYKCQTLLVIFGPFYSELPVNETISLDTKGPVDSIYGLGMWEPVNAFFAMPDGSNVLWVYYRTNYIAEHRYECKKPLVTAKRSGPYLHRYGAGNPASISYWTGSRHEISEETLFQHVGAFKGKINPIEAPDPLRFEEGYMGPASPLKGSDQTYLYIIIAVGVLLIVTMCIICMIAIRKRIKRRRQMKTIRSGNLENSSQAEKSTRSLLSRHPVVSSGASGLNRKTGRSSLTATSSPHKISSRWPDTVRSSRKSNQTKAGATVRSPSLNSGSSRARSRSKQQQSMSRNPSSTSSNRSSGNISNRSHGSRAKTARSAGHT